MSEINQTLRISAGNSSMCYSQLLSICIPTYNRADYLEQCLSAVVPQACEHGINIYVADNGSTDSTKSIVTKYKRLAREQVHSIRHEINLGYDLNHKAVIEMANSEFAWLLGDDDVVLEGAVKKIIDEIVEHSNCELFLLNALLTDNELKPRDTQFHIEQNIVLDDCNELLARNSDKLTFGMMVINARLFNATNADRFIGTSHYYSGVVYEYLAECHSKNGRNCIRILKEPFVNLRQGEREWTHAIGDISVRQIPEFYFRMHPYYAANSKIALRQATGSYRIILPMVRLRAEGWLTKEKTAELLKYYIGSYRYRLLVIACLPITFAKWIAVFGMAVSKFVKAIKRAFFVRKHG